MKKLLIVLGMLLAVSTAYASENYGTTNINILNPMSIKYYNTDLCRWWSLVRFANGTMGYICNSIGQAQIADAFSVYQELEALKARIEKLEKSQKKINNF